jgi:hypothetical protein
MKAKQKILVFQQSGSAETKIAGIEQYGEGQFTVEVISIDEVLPPVIDDASDLLPSKLDADLVLDFFRHPDLSEDLARLCSRLNIPVIASGKKIRGQHVLTPPT